MLAVQGPFSSLRHWAARHLSEDQGPSLQVVVALFGVVLFPITPWVYLYNISIYMIYLIILSSLFLVLLCVQQEQDLQSGGAPVLFRASTRL